TGQMLVIPSQPPGIHIQSEGGITAKIGGGRFRNRFDITAMACRAGVWSRVGNAPIGRFADRIIRPTESPRRCGTHGFGRVSPTGISGRIIRTGHGIESPDFLSRPGIVSDDVTVDAASSRTTAPRQHLIAENSRSGSERPARFCFPSKLAGSGVQP